MQQSTHVTYGTSDSTFYQPSPCNYFHHHSANVDSSDASVNFDHPHSAVTYVSPDDAYSDQHQQQQQQQQLTHYNDICNSGDSTVKGNNSTSTVIFDPSVSYLTSSLDHSHRDVSCNTLNHHTHHTLVPPPHHQLTCSTYNQHANNSNSLVTSIISNTNDRHVLHHLHHHPLHSNVSHLQVSQASRCNDLICNNTITGTYDHHQQHRRTDSCTLSSCSSPSSSLTGISGDIHSNATTVVAASASTVGHLSRDSIISQQQQQQSAPMLLHQVHHQHIDTTCDASTLNSSIDASISTNSTCTSTSTTGGTSISSSASLVHPCTAAACAASSSSSAASPSSTINCHPKPQQQQLMHQAKVLHSTLHQQMPILPIPQAPSQTLHQFNHSYPDTSDCWKKIHNDIFLSLSLLNFCTNLQDTLEYITFLVNWLLACLCMRHAIKSTCSHMIQFIFDQLVNIFHLTRVCVCVWLNWNVCHKLQANVNANVIVNHLHLYSHVLFYPLSQYYLRPRTRNKITRHLRLVAWDWRYTWVKMTLELDEYTCRANLPLILYPSDLM